MSEKKKFGEFHDPDYKQFHPKQLTAPQPISNEKSPIRLENLSTSKPNQTKPTSPDDRRKAICRVIDAEFQRELTAKEDEIDEINRRLEGAKHLLAKVRYAVVHSYYSKKSLLVTPDEMAMVEKSDQQSMTNFIGGPTDAGKAQMPIHPSLKKLLGKRPIDYNEILKTRSPREAAKNATQQFHKLVKKPKETIFKIGKDITIPSESMVEENSAQNENNTSSSVAQIPKKPRYVAPSASAQTIPQINSARGRNHYRHLLVVGNTSKYIGDEEAGLATNVTHKWLVYVTAKTEIPVEKIVKSVRFFLHESYAPNHVADVSSPPFKLAKRGWGEFPIRVQLHFHDHLLQKPLQIYHTLVLDKKHTGLQTMGAETVVELWLNIPNTLANSDGECSKSQKPSAPKIDGPTEQSVPMINSNIAKTSLEHLSLIQNIKKEIETEAEQSDCLPEQLLQDSVGDVKPIMHANQSSCNQNKPIATTTLSTPAPMKPKPALIALPKVIPSVMNGPGTKLIKCVTKDGKVSFLQLVQDPNNPKLFKMALPKAPAINQPQSLQKLNLIKLPPNNQQLIRLKEEPNQTNPIQMPTTVRPSVTIVKSNPLKRANTTPLLTIISNKIAVVDSNRKPQPQQRSLLRPQVSLLKSSAAQNIASVVSSNKNNGKVITVSNILGLENKNINIFLPSELQSPTNSTASEFGWNAFNQPHIELKKRFLLKTGFSNVTDAVSWLLKEIPLIDRRAQMSEFKDLFPFVVSSFCIFRSLKLAKQRNFEWLRAKYINRLIAEHEQFTATRKWSTKEIVIYGRWYGYTPHSVIVETLSDPSAEQNVRDIVKTELIKEHLHNDMISFNARLMNWIENYDEQSMNGTNILLNDEIITVDDDGGDNEALNKSLEDLKRQKDSKLTHLSVPDKFQNELMLVNDMCRRHQIHCAPEEIDDGILHRSSELVLVAALRSFVEDLIRKSVGFKAKATASESSASEIKTDDILQTISRIPHFDFLTNKNLGIHRTDSKK